MSTIVTINNSAQTQVETKLINNGLGSLLKAGASKLGGAVKKIKTKAVGTAPSQIMQPKGGKIVATGMGNGTKGFMGSGGKLSKKVKIGLGAAVATPVALAGGSPMGMGVGALTKRRKKV